MTDEEVVKALTENFLPVMELKVEQAEIIGRSNAIIEFIEFMNEYKMNSTRKSIDVDDVTGFLYQKLDEVKRELNSQKENDKIIKLEAYL